MTAHQKAVEYDFHDKRPDADWMKCHALVGVETQVIMAVEFSGVYGSGTHDLNFLEPLVETAITTFPLEYLLGDKAYLAERIPKWLAERGIRAVIPIKKGWFRDQDRVYNEPLAALVEWFDRNENRDFHEVYRLRSKIECLFSVLKRVADGYCWSRGRKRQNSERQRAMHGVDQRGAAQVHLCELTHRRQPGSPDRRKGGLFRPVAAFPRPR